MRWSRENCEIEFHPAALGSSAQLFVRSAGRVYDVDYQVTFKAPWNELPEEALTALRYRIGCHLILSILPASALAEAQDCLLEVAAFYAPPANARLTEASSHRLRGSVGSRHDRPTVPVEGE